MFGCISYHTPHITFQLYTNSAFFQQTPRSLFLFFFLYFIFLSFQDKVIRVMQCLHPLKLFYQPLTSFRSVAPRPVSLRVPSVETHLRINLLQGRKDTRPDSSLTFYSFFFFSLYIFIFFFYFSSFLFTNLF